MLNITLVVALLLLLLILPGAIFRRAYHTSLLSNYHYRSSNFSEVVITLGIGTVIQLLSVYTFNFFTDDSIDLGRIGELIISPSRAIFDDINKHLPRILIYNLSVCTVAYLLGRILLRLVLWGQFDFKFQSLKFDNDWHYFFRRKKKKGFVYFKMVSVLVKESNGYNLYHGLYSNYSINSDGSLEFIEILAPRKKFISIDNNLSTDYIRIHADKLLIPYREIANLSISDLSITIKSEYKGSTSGAMGKDM